MSQDKEKTHVVHMPRYIQWQHSSSLDYEILFLESVCWLEFKTEMSLPKATNLHLYFKMYIGNSGYTSRQTRTPEITIKTADDKVSTGFIKEEDMKEDGYWRWVPVYSNKIFKDYMEVSSACEQTCTIHWFSENPMWYRNISWGGLTFVKE
ncbi:unnamed protein product [Oikopleura dioica]|uniref:Uncharacterized protein n=1 Tax=Oikopleura dioica TaxID=34765 RepID=E4WXW1_OIKDI|nr:unnamed protein product [Oikopleura dioica]